MTDTTHDDIDLAIHEEAWAIVERIKDKTRVKLHTKVAILADGQLRLDTPLPPALIPGDYTVTILIENPSQEK